MLGFVFVFLVFFSPEKHRVTDLGYSRRSHSVHSFYSAESFSSDMTHQVPKLNTHLSDSGFLTLKPVLSPPGSLWTVTMSFTLKCYMRAKSLQLCLTICDPMDCSPPGSSVHGILQARTLEWVAVSFSRRSSRPSDQTSGSYVSCTGSQVLYHYRHLGSPEDR